MVSVVADYGGVSDEGDASACKNTVLRGRRNRDADGGCSAFFSPSLQKKCVILKNSLNPAFVRPRYEDDRPQDIVAVGRMDRK